MHRFIAFVFLCLISAPGGASGQYVAPETVDGAETIDAAQAKALHDQGHLFIDLRVEKDFAQGHIPGAKNINIAASFSKEGLAKLASQDKIVVFYCYGISCLRTYTASNRAVTWGYHKVKYFRTGFPAWVEAGYPVAAPRNN